MYIYSKFGKNNIMIKAKYNLVSVKEKIKSFYEKQVYVKVNLGRNKIIQYRGILSGIYPALFTVSPNDKNFRGKTTYAYSEILCGNVKVKEI